MLHMVIREYFVLLLLHLKLLLWHCLRATLRWFYWNANWYVSFEQQEKIITMNFHNFSPSLALLTCIWKSQHIFYDNIHFACKTRWNLCSILFFCSVMVRHILIWWLNLQCRGVGGRGDNGTKAHFAFCKWVKVVCHDSIGPVSWVIHPLRAEWILDIREPLIISTKWLS